MRPGNVVVESTPSRLGLGFAIRPLVNPGRVGAGRKIVKPLPGGAFRGTLPVCIAGTWVVLCCNLTARRLHLFLDRSFMSSHHCSGRLFPVPFEPRKAPG